MFHFEGQSLTAYTQSELLIKITSTDDEKIELNMTDDIILALKKAWEKWENDQIKRYY